MTETAATQNKDKVSKATSSKPVKIGPVQRKCACGKHAGAEQDEARLQRMPTLQRTCACGQHTVGGSTCPSCRQTRLNGTGANGYHQEMGGEQPVSIEGARNHHDLTGIPVAPVASAVASVRQSGGEGSGDDETDVIVGGETRPMISTISQGSGQPLQREGNSATLSFATVTAPHNLGCGGFRDQVRWELNGADADTNGFVVQKVTFDLLRERCDGGDNNLQITYWEAWQVRNGEIFIGTGASRHNADTFNVPAAPNHRGSCYEAGWAKFMPDYEEPHSWGNIPMARALPSTTSEPLGWSDSGTLHRYMRNTFDCCEQSDMGNFESGGRSNA